jgi:hypothetical protein
LRKTRKKVKPSRYANGEPVTQDRMEDEEWYPYYSSLMECMMGDEFSFSAIKGPQRVVDLWHGEWDEFKDLPAHKDRFPSDEQVLRWAVLQVERHNCLYNGPRMIDAFRRGYAGLAERLKDWTDDDIAIFEVAAEEKKTGNPEFYKVVDVEGGLPPNKSWIYGGRSELLTHVTRVLNGFVDFGILEYNEDEGQYRWRE